MSACVYQNKEKIRYGTVSSEVIGDLYNECLMSFHSYFSFYSFIGLWFLSCLGDGLFFGVFFLN